MGNGNGVIKKLKSIGKYVLYIFLIGTLLYVISVYIADQKYEQQGYYRNTEYSCLGGHVWKRCIYKSRDERLWKQAFKYDMIRYTSFFLPFRFDAGGCGPVVVYAYCAEGETDEEIFNDNFKF